MPINWSIKLRRPNQKDLFPPIYIILLVSLFTSAFEIKTAWLGWLIILITAIVPTAINIVLAVWLVSFLKTSRILKFVIFIPISFLLGINTLLPKLFAPYPVQATTASIVRTVDVHPFTRVDEGLMRPRLADEANNPIGPSALGIDLDWDYDCGCPWFGPGPDADYEWEVWDVINAKLHRQRGIESTNYLLVLKRMVDGVHFDVRFIKVASVPDVVDLSVDVYEGRIRTAVFEQRNLPTLSMRHESRPSGELLRRELLKYSTSMLLHRNFWVYILHNRIEGFPSAPLRSFLTRAINVT